MKGRLYFATKAQKEGKIMIKTHPCAQIFCCDFCGFEQVQHFLLGKKTKNDFALFCCTAIIVPLGGAVIQT